MRARGIQVYVGFTVTAALAASTACFALFGNTLDLSRSGLLAIAAFAVLALLTVLFESSAAAGMSGSVAFVAHLASMVVLGPVAAAISSAVSVLVAQVWLRKERIKVVFNVAQTVLCSVVPGSVYLLAGGQLRPVTARDADFIAFGLLVVTYFGINSAAVSGAVAISQGKPFGGMWRSQMLRAAGYDLVASALGFVVAWMYLRFGYFSILAVMLPIMAFRQAYRDNAELKRANEELEARHRDLLDYTVKQIEARDPYTSGHSRRVAEYAQIIAREAGLSAKEVDNVATAALLHDVGKVYHEFGSVLQKEGRLTPEEKALLQSHPVRSAELIATISNLRGGVEEAVRHHHENFDGTGYPDGLKGEGIPIGSRIIMIADTLDAMTTDRPYRKALTFERVLEETRKYAGRQFDPHLAEILATSAAIRRLVGAAMSVNLDLAPSLPAPRWVARARV